jgi:hypothetical protein
MHKMPQSVNKTQSNWCKTSMEHKKLKIRLRRITAPREPDDNWRAIDIHISLWFMGTLSDELYRLVQGSDGIACTTLNRLHQFFLNNQSSSYLYLSKALRSTPYDDMSIMTYASKLQSITKDLAAIECPPDDRDLTL